MTRLPLELALRLSVARLHGALVLVHADGSVDERPALTRVAANG